MPRAASLQDAYDVLDPEPIDFERHADYYVEPPARTHDDQTVSPKPLDRIRRALRTTQPAKVFLAGHVGAGKSTQLRKLASDPDITSKFTVVPVQLEAAELPFLDAGQLQFHLALALYTRGKSLDSSRSELLRAIEHMYPERVLDKTQHFDPMKAYLDDAWPFFRDALFHRVEDRLFTEDGARTAMAYSGGVVRDYFRLLKEASAIAEQSGQEGVGALEVKGAVREERLRWTRSLTHEDHDALLDVHRTHKRRDTEQHRRLLDLGLMLECYNDDTWYEVHPLLWASIERHSQKEDA